jgi:hypothetical protein
MIEMKFISQKGFLSTSFDKKIVLNIIFELWHKDSK